MMESRNELLEYRLFLRGYASQLRLATCKLGLTLLRYGHAKRRLVPRNANVHLLQKISNLGNVPVRFPNLALCGPNLFHVWQFQPD
jgi:hypothetical protein